MFDGPSFAQGTVIGNGDVRAVSYGEDKGLYVEFSSEPFYNEFQSKQQGHPIYDHKTMVKIYVPGDKTKVVHRLALLTDEESNGIPPDPMRWPKQWEAFKAGAKAIESGTPLSEWPQMTKGQVTEFNALGIYTVEQLANVPDGLLENLGHGSRSVRDGAQKWLDRAGDDAAINKMEAKHADDMAALRAEMEAQIALLRETAGETRRLPGRPRKEEV